MEPATTYPDQSVSNTPAFIASLIESAAHCYEVDRAAARSYLFRAHALLRIQAAIAPEASAGTHRGGLATWQAMRVVGHIDANITGRMESKELARLVHLSVGHFFRAFKVSLGLTPRDYITRKRMERALEIMRDSDMPLAQVALACGLNDQSTFCRVFRRAMGQSPNVWRRTHMTRREEALPQR